MIQRFKTREVMVGKIGIGGQNPVRIQSMTNTDTLDTQATAEQAIRLFEAGCEMVRITAPGIRDAENLAAIKAEILRRGYEIPLIADIHYSPKAAEVAAAFVEKVRVNPGNYTDRNRGKINFTESEYRTSLVKIRENIAPLIQVCKKHHTALRIGSNHGSLSDRIVDRYGDTPLGMVEAALEFARICRDEDFHDIVFSMKASNVRVMVYATRLLVRKMMEEGMDYPVHLGVTEAGNDIEGRIKSAVGIGTLLAEGIGDTIRVSLTEDPVNEIPVARKIVAYFQSMPGNWQLNISDLQVDYAPRYSDRLPADAKVNGPFVIGLPGKYGNQKPDILSNDPVISSCQKIEPDAFSGQIKPVITEKPILVTAGKQLAVQGFRRLFKKLGTDGLRNPVILHKKYMSGGMDLALEAAMDFGPLFLDGLADGIWIESGNEDPDQVVSLAFDILQASGARISKTEYIACPSCGRTQYDIQKALSDIKKATSNFTGLKIAVMGCIVNGPGEMADADYGYVGMGAGKVALYKGKKLMKKGVDESEAVEELVRLIMNYRDRQDN